MAGCNADPQLNGWVSRGQLQLLRAGGNTVSHPDRCRLVKSCERGWFPRTTDFCYRYGAPRR